MPPLEFHPCKLREWAPYRHGLGMAHATGWASKDQRVLDGVELAVYALEQLQAGKTFPEILAALNGNFAIIADDGASVHLGVDAVRSIPLFYRVDQAGLHASDDLRELRAATDRVDPQSLLEYLAAGFVTGAHTLFAGIHSLQSAECLSWAASDPAPRTQRYYRYACSYDDDGSVPELCSTFDQIVLRSFERMVASLRGRQVVVPLSGGLDSRLVASALRRCGYENVVCLSYGAPGNKETPVSRLVARRLGYPWIQVPYTREVWKDALRSPDMRSYWSFAANGSSLPHPDDWVAVSALRRRQSVAEDAVFAPGHTGDFICGSHLKYVFATEWHDDPSDLVAAMMKKHYSLWGELPRNPTFRNLLQQRLREALGPWEGSEESVAAAYEAWEWQERQAKYIINAVRVYEFFGYGWRIPLWDREIMDFWRGVQLDLKLGKRLYLAYLATHDPTGVFTSEAQATPRSTPWVASSIKRGLAAGRFGVRGRRIRSHLEEYRHGPVGLARGYGAFRFLLREPTKRHAQALLLKDVLRAEYGMTAKHLDVLLHERASSTEPGAVNTEDTA